MFDSKTVNMLQLKAMQLRLNIIEMIGVGKAGHLGGSSSLAEIVSALYFSIMKIDPDNPRFESRDRFILSKGHAVLVQYAALAELGFFPREELKKTKTMDGILQGHPDMDMTPGIEAVTGSLGQGLSISVGLALGMRLDNSQSRVYTVLGDGELSEGQVWEAAMAAARFGVDNLLVFLDKNGIQATGPTDDIFPIPVLEEKWKSFGWNVMTINGHDIPAILEASEKAKHVKKQPTIIIAETVKGKCFSFAENNAAFHNGILTQELYDTAVNELIKQIGEVKKQ